MIAWILGAIEPLAKCVPSARYCLASARVIWSSHFLVRLAKVQATFSTAVEIRNRSALISLRQQAAGKIFVDHRRHALVLPSPASITGIPPPPTVMTTTPASIRVLTDPAQPPLSAAGKQPPAASRARHLPQRSSPALPRALGLGSSIKPPMGLLGFLKAVVFVDQHLGDDGRDRLFDLRRCSSFCRVCCRA
jgi:hypothetical protein